MKDHSCGLVHERARETVAASGDVSTAIRLARLVAAGRETEVRTHRSRSRKPARVFNSGDVHQRGERTDTWHCHQQTANWIRPDLLQHRLIEYGDLLAQLSPRRGHGRTTKDRQLEHPLPASIARLIFHRTLTPFP